jgi:hypothetical protein
MTTENENNNDNIIEGTIGPNSAGIWSTSAVSSTSTMNPYLTNPFTISTGAGIWDLADMPSGKELKKLMTRMEKIEDRLAILTPSQNLQDRFPALQEAYDSYKMIEKLVQDPIKGQE